MLSGKLSRWLWLGHFYYGLAVLVDHSDRSSPLSTSHRLDQRSPYVPHLLRIRLRRHTNGCHWWSPPTALLGCCLPGCTRTAPLVRPVWFFGAVIATIATYIGRRRMRRELRTCAANLSNWPTELATESWSSSVSKKGRQLSFSRLTISGVSTWRVVENCRPILWITPHKEVVAEKLYSPSVGIFSWGAGPLPAWILAGQRQGQNSSEI